MRVPSKTCSSAAAKVWLPLQLEPMNFKWGVGREENQQKWNVWGEHLSKVASASLQAMQALDANKLAPLLAQSSGTKLTLPFPVTNTQDKQDP